MNIVEATAAYEVWLRAHTPIVEPDLQEKHRQMAGGAFEFLRATFYLWSRRILEICPDLADAPHVLAVGDLHVANFGTWRDAEGRLIWGINDFDEAADLPYTFDLVRLATSAVLAGKGGHLHIDEPTLCAQLLVGYQRAMGDGPEPFVLAERHGWLGELAIDALRDPEPFWSKIAALPDVPAPPPLAARNLIEQNLPARGLAYRLKHRSAGLGSLGRLRFAALADWRGGYIAREVKPLVPSAVHFADGTAETHPPQYQQILEQAVRCHDPFMVIGRDWIFRRLAPDCTRVDLAALARTDQSRLLKACGRETANIHLGDIRGNAIAADLKARPPGWLQAAATRMAAAVAEDWKQWKKAAPPGK